MASGMWTVRRSLECGAAAHRAATRGDWIFPQELDSLGIGILGGGHVIAAAVELHDVGLLAAAEPLRRLGNAVEHELHVRGEREMTLRTSLMAV